MVQQTKKRPTLNDATWDYDEIVRKREQYMAPSLQTFTAFERPLLLSRGDRQYVWDADGKRYLDCLAQNLCISVGYNHPRVNKAIIDQMQAIQHVTTMYYHPEPVAFSEELVARMPAGEDWVVHLVNSGAEAIDLAILMARTYSRNFDLLCLRNSYHGMHFGAMAASGLALCRQPVATSPGFVHAYNPDQYRGIFGPGVEPYIEDLRRVIDSATCGEVAGIMIEPIQGYGGVIPVPKGYIRKAAALVRSAGGVCIIDEVQTGFGRTGDHFWGFEIDDVVPDVVVMSKGIGNGFPLAAVVARREVAEPMTVRKFFNTYGSNPMASAAGRAVLAAIDEEDIQENAREVGKALTTTLGRLKAKYDVIGDVRGRGLMQGIEFVSDHTMRKPADKEASRVQECARENGVILGRSGQHKNVLRINPPLCMSMDDVKLLEQALDGAVARL
ncbi:MAG: aspartate aminotransferase family protein [Hyphomicrobiaceae bacterium]|nr:MAG: aspartate aminotransferase family protein [Hyphomicrobiaceae bacterium]